MHEVHTSSTACGKMWKSLMSWGSVMNHRRVQWNHGEAQRQHLPASAAGRGSRARVGEGLCNTSAWDSWRGACNTFAIWRLVM